MYELLLVAGAGLLSLRAFSEHSAKEYVEDHSTSIRRRLGRLWEITHQGMRENRLLRAEKALLTILKIDKSNAAAYNRLGILYAKQKEYKDAIDCFEMACTIEPTASSLHNLGLIYFETEKYDKSVVAFEDALKYEEIMAARHVALAKSLEHIGNSKQMIKHLERASELEPNKESYNLLARTYRKYNMPEKADQLEDKVKRMKSKPNTRQRLRRKRRVA